MIELIAGMGIGLWCSLAITVTAVLYGMKHDLLGERRDAMLRRDVDNAQDNIAELENHLQRLDNSLTETIMHHRKALSEIHKMLERISRGEEEDTSAGFLDRQREG